MFHNGVLLFFSCVYLGNGGARGVKIEIDVVRLSTGYAEMTLRAPMKGRRRVLNVNVCIGVDMARA